MTSDYILFCVQETLFKERVYMVIHKDYAWRSMCGLFQILKFANRNPFWNQCQYTVLSFPLTSIGTNNLLHCKYICSHVYVLTGKSCRMTHVKKRGPRREDKSNLFGVSGFGISFTNSNNILVPGPSRN